ncbi:Hypothetical protein I595_3249 [Croceitalea dokdonensis DOKDO 023]|uniref:Uncharacterized protein n=1 Tax=Croceitalea dokdonensis DOKDO 023 TaxID=1300341 RepID=A0A0P7AC18_9FLAO|nr:hypothetical protein [Croceitalea dokdonensis]KPM30752.1 Hypothetical protein I595_3249 [Croceitalea dokdonensis DOKDO 023]
MLTYSKRFCVSTLLFAGSTLFLLFSFSLNDPCAFANQHTEFIKSQTKRALKAPSLELSKFYAYKALKGIFKTADNFESCGCNDAYVTIKKAELSLRQATQANDHQTSLQLLQSSLQLTEKSLDKLHAFRNTKSLYTDDVLTMNTIEGDTMKATEHLSLPKQEVDIPQEFQQKVDEKITNFKTSITDLRTSLTCEEVKDFLTNVQEFTKLKLADDAITPVRKLYHVKMLEATYEELAGLHTCLGK